MMPPNEGDDGPAPIVIALSADDIRLALVSYALPLARMMAGGGELQLGHVEIVEQVGGPGCELSAVVEWERVEGGD